MRGKRVDKSINKIRYIEKFAQTHCSSYKFAHVLSVQKNAEIESSTFMISPPGHDSEGDGRTASGR